MKWMCLGKGHILSHTLKITFEGWLGVPFASLIAIIMTNDNVKENWGPALRWCVRGHIGKEGSSHILCVRMCRAQMQGNLSTNVLRVNDGLE